MARLNLNTAVGNVVAEHPQTSRVFESLQIDYCCGGATTLSQACAAQSIDSQEVLNRLQQAIEAGTDDAEQDWHNALLANLCDHIVETHHAYLRAELPRLTELIAKVVAAHGDAHVELAEVQQVFAALRRELEPHMLKEEQILFPAIRQLEQSDDAQRFPFGSIGNPVRMMEHEHDFAGQALSQLRKLTRQFELPAGACNTYHAMLDGLAALEENTHQHVHKENNILFPKAIALETARTGA